jgi:hypothetical protein
VAEVGNELHIFANEVRLAYIRTGSLQGTGDTFGFTRERARQYLQEFYPGFMAHQKAYKRALTKLNRKKDGWRRQSARLKWPRALCLARLHKFYELHGRAPTAAELGAGMQGAAEMERISWLPYWGTLQQKFGSARNALILAGVPPREVGHYARKSKIVERADTENLPWT